MDAQSKLSNEIVQIAVAHWQQQQKPIYLARLGGRLSPEAKSELQTCGLSLKNFILERMQNQIRLFVIGETGDAILPIDVLSGETDAELAKRYASASTRQFNRFGGRRFVREFWLAFLRPIDTGKRYVEFDNSNELKIVDITADEAVPDGAFEITSDDLPPFNLATGRAFPSEVEIAIREWSKKNSVNLERLHDKSEQFFTTKIGKTHTDDGDNFTNEIATKELTKLLELFETHELSKINIPADVILSVLRRMR